MTTIIITDQARRQEIQNSINEGQLILTTGKLHGRKLSIDELSAVKHSVDNAKVKLGEA